MRRFILVLAVAAVMAVMLVAMVAPAFAGVKGGTNFGGSENNSSTGRFIGGGSGGGDAHVDQGQEDPPSGGLIAHNPHPQQG